MPTPSMRLAAPARVVPVARGAVVALAFVVVSIAAVALSSSPATASTWQQQEEQDTASWEEFSGVYTVDVPDMGVIRLTIARRDDGTLTISAMDQPAQALQHVEASRFEVETSEYGTVLVEFQRDDEGRVASVYLESYEFSLVAVKQGT